MAAAANPDRARKARWKAHPDMKPNKIDEQAAVANDLTKISASLNGQANASKLNPDALFAGAGADAMGACRDFLFAAGILTEKVKAEALVIPEGRAFWSKINDFDKAAIETAAKTCNYRAVRVPAVGKQPRMPVVPIAVTNKPQEARLGDGPEAGKLQGVGELELAGDKTGHTMPRSNRPGASRSLTPVRRWAPNRAVAGN